MKKLWIAALVSLIGWSPIAAQFANQNTLVYDVGGDMLSNGAMSVSDLFSLSQAQFNFGSARSMAMGGAFASLGADQASMSLNPAGLGMYRRSELTFTPMMTMSRSTSNATPYEGNSKNRFALGNLGIALNVYEGTGSLMSLNIGIGYNRLADYNYKYSLQYGGGNSSIADAMAVQLERANIGLTSNGTISDGMYTNWDIDPAVWTGVAAYKAFMLDMNGNGLWYPPEIGANSIVAGGATVTSIGSAGEFDIAMGANVNNKLYFGFTLGIQRVYQKKEYYYGEAYTYGSDNGNGYNSDVLAEDGDGNVLSSVMQSMGMTQTSILNGTGVNFKLGVTYRPFAGLRLAAALHTPTYYALERRYQMALATVSIGATDAENGNFQPHEYTSEQISPEVRDDGDNSWSFVSPTRLMFGASYTFGNVAILSVDYERDWYNGIRMKDSPYVPSGQSGWDFKQDFKHYFKGSNTIRVGAELKPLPMLAIRAGFGYNGSMLKDSETILTAPAVYETMYYTGGLGFNFGKVFVDLAYCYAKNKMTPYMLYYGNIYDDRPGYSDEIHTSDVYRTDITRHNVALTLGFRF